MAEVDPADLTAFQSQTPSVHPADLAAFEQQSAPKQKPISGTILPFSVDENNKLTFPDWNAGVPGMIKRAVTLPADVITGKVRLPSSVGIPGSILPGEPGADDAYGRIAEAAMLMSPSTAALKATTTAVAPSVRAAQTAVDLGAPLPRGIATENTGIQAVTQGARSLPYVGQKIDERLASTASAASERLAGDTQQLTGGITSRADVGETMRAPLGEVIKSNKNTIDSEFTGLRAAIEPDAQIVPRNLGQALIEIGQSRRAAGSDNPGGGLENLVNLVRSGASFNGMQRARSELAESIDFGAAHGGFTAGDKKLLMGALSRDMEAAVQSTAKIDPTEALGLYRSANKTFQELSAENKNISGVLGSQRDSLLAGKLIAAASGKTGDPVLLATLKNKLPAEDFDRVAGSVLHEMGKNQSGEFSLNLFSKSWSRVGERQKNILFGQRKQFYDDIANLSSFVRGTEQYKNTSGTGRAGTLSAVIGALAGGATTAVATGSIVPLAGAAGAVAGGYALAKALASPAGAASVARMARAAENYTKGPNAAKRATLMIAARDAGKTLESLGSSGMALLRQLEGPLKATADPDQD